MIRRSLPSLVILGCLATLGIPHVARANMVVTEKIVTPGADCSGTFVRDFNALQVDFNDGAAIWNPNATQAITCPLPREAKNAGGAHPYFLFSNFILNVYNPDAASRFTCTAWARNQDNTEGYYRYAESGLGPAFTTVDFSPWSDYQVGVGNTPNWYWFGSQSFQWYWTTEVSCNAPTNSPVNHNLPYDGSSVLLSVYVNHTSS